MNIERWTWKPTYNHSYDISIYIYEVNKFYRLEKVPVMFVNKMLNNNIIDFLFSYIIISKYQSKRKKYELKIDS